MESAAKIYAGIIFPNGHSKTEPNLSDLQKAMLDATPDCIKLLSLDGRLLTMNRAGCLALNVAEDSEFGMQWLPLLPMPVHPMGQEALRQAADGHNARFPGQSESPAGMRYWDNLLTPIVDASGYVQSILCVSRDVTATKQLERELETAIGRERLLAEEMQHRVKNLFSVVLGLITISEKDAVEAGVPDTATKILRGKIDALSRASDAVFSSNNQKFGDSASIDLSSLVHSVLKPYGDRCKANGNEVSIFPDNTTILALFFHELATNSVKYGALSVDGGKVIVHWATDKDRLNLTWTEHNGPLISAPPSHEGFGSNMVERIARSVGGGIHKIWRKEGLMAELQLPNSALPENNR